MLTIFNSGRLNNQLRYTGFYLYTVVRQNRSFKLSHDEGRAVCAFIHHWNAFTQQSWKLQSIVWEIIARKNKRKEFSWFPSNSRMHACMNTDFAPKLLWEIKIFDTFCSFKFHFACKRNWGCCTWGFNTPDLFWSSKIMLCGSTGKAYWGREG